MDYDPLSPPTRRALLGVRTGADLTLPPITAKGVGVRVRWGMFRYMAGLEVGLRF